MNVRAARTVTLLVALVQGIAITMVGLGVDPATAIPQNTTRQIDFASDLRANGAAADEADRLQPLLEQFADFAGVRITDTGVEVSLTEGPSSATIESTARQTLTYFDGYPVPLVFRTVLYSKADMDSTVRALNTDRDSLAGEGINLIFWGAQISRNRVVIHLQTYDVASEQRLKTKYGDIIDVASSSGEVLASSDRTNDSVPWYGADSVLINNAAGCTSWFSLKSVSHAGKYFAVAGHCGLKDVTNGSRYQGTIDAVNVHWNNGGTTDVALYRVSDNLPDVWVDPNPSSIRLVTSRNNSGSDATGTLLCNDGAPSKERCTQRVDTPDASTTYSGKTLYHQVYAYDVNIDNTWIAGDSGGPIYKAVGSDQAQAYGMEISRYCASDRVSCPGGFYTPARYIFPAYSSQVPDLTFTPAG